MNHRLGCPTPRDLDSGAYLLKLTQARTGKGARHERGGVARALNGLPLSAVVARSFRAMGDSSPCDRAIA